MLWRCPVAEVETVFARRSAPSVPLPPEAGILSNAPGGLNSTLSLPAIQIFVTLKGRR